MSAVYPYWWSVASSVAPAFISKRGIHEQVDVAGVEEAGVALLEYVLRSVERFETGAGSSVRVARLQAEPVASGRVTYGPTKRRGRGLDEDMR